MITIEVNDRAFRDYLAQLAERMDDLEPVLSSVGQELETRISGRFESQTDPNGASWHPWADSTKKTYPKDGNRRILDRYGDMLASLSWQADTSKVSVGFGQAISVYHEFGTRFMPRRGLLFEDPDAGTLAPDDLSAVLDIIGAWLEED